MRFPVTILAASALLFAAETAPAAAPGTFEEAKALAAEQGKPLLVDFYATWCGPCKAFTKATETDEEISKALESVVLFKIDAEKGAGVDLAKKYRIQGFPTFVLANADGETLERWSGYEKEAFLTTAGDAFADLTTIEQKKARFHQHPTVRDADKLARYHDTGGDHVEAIALYEKVEELDAQQTRAFDILNVTFSGFREDAFTADDVTAAARNVLADDGRGQALYTTYKFMKTVESKANSPGLATPFLEPALKAAEAESKDGTAAQGLRVEHALRVEHDTDRAFELKVAMMPEGWKDDSANLNNVAWWCFENSVKLDEAELLARRGAELAPPGKERAMVLDTVAEICNARGNCPEALVLIRQAIEEDPDNEYYPKQLQRFENLAASTN